MSTRAGEGPPRRGTAVLLRADERAPLVRQLV
jgi:hypothetical protein